MAYYRGSESTDRWKAAAAVLAVHVALAAVIVTGLNVDIVSRAVERLSTFDIAEPTPPPPPPPPPPSQQPRAREEEGAAGKKADPTPVVAPVPKVEVPADPPIAAAPVPGTGSASSAGAASSGSGTGAGGSGSGRGGGGSGSGDYSGFTPAVLIRNLNRSDYRPLAAGRLPRGSAMVSLRVDTSGAPTNCRVVRSSGDGTVDSGLCPLITGRLRFRPARDASGNAVPYSLQYVANWTL